MNDGNRPIREFDSHIQSGNGGIAPVLYLTQVNVGEQRAGEAELTGSDTIEIYNRHDRADHHGKLGQAIVSKLLGRQRGVRGAEINHA